MNQQELTKLLVDSYKQAPPFIQRFISSGALSKFVEQTQDKYKLHIDVAGRLSDEITMLMVGITDPKEFIQNLAKEALVPEASLSLIVAEINQKIFVPLREEMRKGPQPQAAPPSPKATEGTARESVLQPRTTIIPANPNLPPRPAEASGVGGPHPAQMFASVPRYIPPKKYFNLQNKIPPPAGSQASAMRDGSLASTDKKLLEDHEEPHIEFNKTPMPVKTAPPPPNLPGVIQPTPIPEPPFPPLPPPAKKPEPVVPVAPYSSDPYREPLEP